MASRMCFGVLVCAAAACACGGCKSHKTTPPVDPPVTAAPDDGWKKEFTVDKSLLGPVGANTYVVLYPGKKSVFRDGQATYTVRVLNLTRKVDGVTTRVVEKRDEVGGKLKQISRTFIAIDTLLGNVYCFGKEVDAFDNGEVTHPGEWLSGVAGARFGMVMPARPKLGDRFCRELAPGIAMDRLEVVGMDESVQTPAGTFEHCLSVRETSLLNSETSLKVFAPQVGLVKAGDAELVSIKPTLPARPGE